MITAAQIKEKILKEREEKRINTVNQCLECLEKATEKMLEESTTYYRFTDAAVIKKILYCRDSEQPELKDWLKKTGFELTSLNNGSAVELYFSM